MLRSRNDLLAEPIPEKAVRVFSVSKGKSPACALGLQSDAHRSQPEESVSYFSGTSAFSHPTNLSGPSDTRPMNRIYQYRGFDISVAVEARFNPEIRGDVPSNVGYVAIVKISNTGTALGIFSPLRLGNPQGNSFVSEFDALMGGYSAGRRMVDDLLVS
jgi:hypothetical protein